MTTNPVRMAGVVCAALTALLLVSISAPAAAQSRDTRLTVAPSVKSVPKVKSPPRVAATGERVRKPNRMPHWNTYTTGAPDLAYLAADQYLALAAYEGAVWLVTENEFSLLDFAAGTVRVVDPEELSEIDLANDPEKMLAEMRPVEPGQQVTFQVASAAPEPAKPEEEDGILNRILMTFAGALALAGAMKLLIA